MTQYQPDEKNRIKRQKSENAIKLAREGKWEEAVTLNQDILAMFPEDPESLNRLGKALLELRRFVEAKEAYEKALKNDPGNSIAQKNLQRLNQAIASGDVGVAKPVATAREKSAAAPSTFIEETGKTGVTSLVGLAATVVLAKLTAGDVVYLEPDFKAQVIRVKNEENEILGQIEPKMSLRLLRFLEAGNRYAAAVTSVGDKQLTIIIRETYQHPSQRGRLSFPPKAGTASYRAYTKDSALRFGFEDEEDNGDDEVLEPDAEGDEGDDEESDVTDDFGDDPERERDEI